MVSIYTISCIQKVQNTCIYSYLLNHTSLSGVYVTVGGHLNSRSDCQT